MRITHARDHGQALLARTARRLLPRRRILAAAASLPLLLGAFTAVAAATAPAAQAASNICLTYDTSYCMAYYPPDLGLSGSGIYGVHLSECSSTNDCGWNLVYEGYWSADGVVGSEYELQTAGNTHYCAATTSLTSSYVGFAACGANGTIWVADAADAAGEYLISRFELNHNPPSGLSNTSIILVYSPADSVEASIGFEWQTGGSTFGRWNF